jgi:hypothetical protein
LPNAAAKGAGAGPHEAWQALKRDSSLQFDFPDMPDSPPPPEWPRKLAEFLAAHAGFFRILGWVLLAIIALAIAFFLIRWLMRRGWARADLPAPHPAPAWQPSTEQARLLLADADALAAAGRHADAVHLLLHVSIQEIGERRPGLVRPAFTSREIATLPALSPMARRIFFEIALVTEKSLFGAQSLGAAEFAQCRAAFEQFLIPDVWQVAA